MNKILNGFALAAVAGLSACGGGGGSAGAGSGGVAPGEYQVYLQADKMQLPLNVGGVGPGISAYRPFTTVIHVNASVAGAPIPDGKDGVFGCNLSSGLKTGALYYLDGNPDHETEVDDGNGGKIKRPNAYRSITLGSNAGGNSFHFHAGDEAGAARITCSVMDPRDKQQKFATVDIVVGAATGKPASVRLIAGSDYVGSKTNLNGLRNQTAVQAFVLDDMNQPVASASSSNVQVRILPGTPAADDARLVAGVFGGSGLLLPSTGGVATFSLLGGSQTGPVFLEMTADRYDNNVSNGVQDAMTTIVPVYVLDALTSNPTVANADLGDVTKGVAFTSLLAVQGGLPPYTWSATGLPDGLSIDAGTGLLSGKVTAAAKEGPYAVNVKVVDKSKLTASAVLKLNVVAGLPEDLAIGTCSSNAVCGIGNAVVDQNFSYAFSASVSGVTWEFAGLPAWLTAGTSLTAGVLSGVPTNVGCYKFLVTAKKGASSVTRTMGVSVSAPAPAPVPLCN